MIPIFSIKQRWMCVLLASLLLGGTPARAQETAVSKSLEGELSRTGVTRVPIIIDVLEVQDMPVRQVLDLIQIKSGINLNMPSEIEGNVTIFLQNVDVRDALRIILDANGLAYQEHNGVFEVMTAEEYTRLNGQKFGQNIQTRILPLLHSSLESVRGVLEEIKSPEGRVVVNVQSNSFVVTDIPERLDAMEAFIRTRDIEVGTKSFTLNHVALSDIREDLEKALTPNVGRIELLDNDKMFSIIDTPTKLDQMVALVDQLDQLQWSFEVRVRTIQIMLEDEHLDGIDWEAIVSKYQTIDFPNAEKLLSNLRELQLGTISNEDVVVLLDALETVGLIHYVQDFKIAVEDGKETSFLMEFMEDGGDRLDDLLQEVQYFIRLKKMVDDTIGFRVRPQFTFRDKYDFGRRVTSSENLTTNKEETVVVGGFFRDVRVDSLWKIPVLGDLPILGFAFRNQYKEKRKSEVILLLTPKVVELTK